MLDGVGRWRRAQAERDPTNLQAMIAAIALENLSRGIPRDVSVATLRQAADLLASPGGMTRAYNAAVAISNSTEVDAEQFLGILIADRSANPAAWNVAMNKSPERDSRGTRLSKPVQHTS